LPAYTRERRPGFPAYTRERRPGLPAYTQERRPGLPAYTPERRPGLPAYTQERRLPAYTQESRPGLPAYTQESRPGLPAYTQESRPGLPAYTQERRPGLPAYTQERRPGLLAYTSLHACNGGLSIQKVIRAKAIIGKEVNSGNDVYGNPIKRIQYEIKQIKMFKGPDKDIEYIFTAPSSAVCGVTLETAGKKEYLIAGKTEGDGKMHITLCDFIVPWDSLSQTQKKNLNQRYEMGCECKVRRIHTLQAVDTVTVPFHYIPWLRIGVYSIHTLQAGAGPDTGGAFYQF
uniref:Metalloproteinase inhibitor 2 n=1 Tax=Leptobrachium leishanense TaxID=445787 RepID=A0A8C5Q121_9ANUR